MNLGDVFNIARDLNLKYDFIDVEDLAYACLFLEDLTFGDLKQWEVDASYDRVRSTSKKLMKLLTTDPALNFERQRLESLLPDFFVALCELEEADPLVIDRVDKQYVGYVLCEMYKKNRGRSGIGGDGDPELIQCVSDAFVALKVPDPDVTDQADYARMLRRWCRKYSGGGKAIEK